jgi:molecular chaperone DnaK
MTEGKPSTSPPTGTESSGVVPRCPHCQLWEIAPEDIYCSFCGRLLLALSATPDPVVLIAGIVREQILTLTNSGPVPIQAVLAPTTPFTGLTFEPAGPFEILPDGQIKIRIHLDASRLPADLRERNLRYACVVDNDPRKVLDVRITVRSGPKPQLLTQTLQFGEVRDGTRVDRSLEIANAGGTPLIVKSVRPEGSSQLFLGGSPPFPLRIEPAGKIAVPVFWDSGIQEKERETGKAGLRVLFANHTESFFVPAKARLFHYLLEAEPPQILLPEALSGHEQIQSVTIENRGSIDIEILHIESNQPWIQVSGQTKGFTLRCSDAAKTRGTGAVSACFYVICRPYDLEEGRHKGQVKILPAGLEAKILEVELNVIRPVEYREYIGIDFGTTNSVVAVMDQETQDIELVQDTLPDGSHSPLIPSVLAFVDGPEHYRIGREARNEAAPDRTVRSIKRIMGYDHAREYFGRKLSPPELASLIIRKLVQLAERHLFEKTKTYFLIRKAIVTVPANFFDLQIRSVLRACVMAGLDTEEEQVRQTADAMKEAFGQEVNAGVILDEPSAAVLYYLHHLETQDRSSEIMQGIDREEGLNLLVFDYGGGTLDVSVANIVRLPQGAAGLKILANMGNNRIGGDSLDLLIMRELLQRCQREVKELDGSLISADFQKIEKRRRDGAWSDLAWGRVLGARSEWKDLAENAKLALSQEEEVLITVPPHLIVRIDKGEVRGAPEEFISILRREEMESLIEGTLVECADLVESALRLAQIPPDQVHYVLHTGRQSLMPAIRRRVRSLFPSLPTGRDLLEERHLKVCVAQGAALYGLMRGMILDPRSGVHFLNEGRRLPHSYGVEKFVGITQRELDDIIPRGSAYPISVIRDYKSMLQPGGRLNLKFYQNLGTRKSITRNRDVRLIGQITAEARINEKPGCQVRFAIDANRKLEVWVNEREVEIEPARISDDETWMG